MTGNSLHRRNVAVQNARCPMRAVFVINAVEAKPPDAAFVPRIWTGINLSFKRQGPMESGVEDGDLRRVGEKFLGEIDPLQPRLVVKWGNL